MTTGLIVNLNGTAKQDLMKQTIMALEILRVAHDRMQQAMPHPRDYPNGGYDFDADKHRERIRQLETMIADMEAIGIHIADQGRH